MAEFKASKLASTSGPAIPGGATVKASKPPVPPKDNSKASSYRDNPATPRQQNITQEPPLDIQAWDRDPIKIYELLTTKKAKVDEYSKLVLGLE
jgi:hypothetical protein